MYKKLNENIIAEFQKSVLKFSEKSFAAKEISEMLEVDLEIIENIIANNT